MNNEIFMILSENQISVDVFDKEKKKVFITIYTS